MVPRERLLVPVTCFEQVIETRSFFVLSKPAITQRRREMEKSEVTFPCLHCGREINHSVSTNCVSGVVCPSCKKINYVELKLRIDSGASKNSSGW